MSDRKVTLSLDPVQVGYITSCIRIAQDRISGGGATLTQTELNNLLDDITEQCSEVGLTVLTSERTNLVAARRPDPYEPQADEDQRQAEYRRTEAMEAPNKNDPDWPGP